MSKNGRFGTGKILSIFNANRWHITVESFQMGRVAPHEWLWQGVGPSAGPSCASESDGHLSDPMAMSSWGCLFK